MKQLISNNQMKKKTVELIRYFRYKMIFFSFLGFIVLCFSCYFITMFCAVYTNTQLHLLKDTFSSFCLSFLYPFGLYLIPGTLRIPALKSKHKNKIYLYKMSQLLHLI